MDATERFDTVVIGGGQAGLSAGYHLAKLGRPLRHPRSAPASRRQLAPPLRLVAAVQPGVRRRPSRDGVPRRATRLSHQGRNGRLPSGLRRSVRATGPKRRLGGPGHQAERRLCGERRRPLLRGSQRSDCHRHLRTALHPRIRRRARYRNRSASFQRVQEPVAAGGGRGARGGGRPFRCRHRPRGNKGGTSHPAVRPRPGTGRVLQRDSSRRVHLLCGSTVCRHTGAHHQDPDRTQGPSRGSLTRGTALAGEAGSPRRRWSGTGPPEDGRRPRWSARPRRRAPARSVQCHLGHRVPTRFLVDRHPLRRRRRVADGGPG